MEDPILVGAAHGGGDGAVVVVIVVVGDGGDGKYGFWMIEKSWVWIPTTLESQPISIFVLSTKELRRVRFNIISTLNEL